MRACLFVLVFAGASCFAEAPDVEPNECAVGSKGCPCTAGGACDAPLECHAQSLNCYDPECDEGSPSCPCFEGMCFVDLICSDGLCQAPMQTSGSGSAEGTTSTSVASSTGITGTVDTGLVDTGELDTGDRFDEAACVACFAEHLGSACSEPQAACTGAMCMNMRDCILAQTRSFSMCCVGIDDGQPDWAEIAACIVTEVCADTCTGIETTCV